MPEPVVLEWLAKQSRASLFATTVTQGEVLCGIRLLADGKRRRGLWDAAKQIFAEDFAGQALSFDSDAADVYPQIGASRRLAGRPMSQFDAMIAGMARSRSARQATRNAKDFESRGFDIADPWGNRSRPFRKAAYTGPADALMIPPLPTERGAPWSDGSVASCWR